MHRVTLQRGVVLLLFQALRVSLSVFMSCVARRRFSLFAGLCAFQRDDSNFALLSHGLRSSCTLSKTLSKLFQPKHKSKTKPRCYHRTRGDGSLSVNAALEFSQNSRFGPTIWRKALKLLVLVGLRRIQSHARVELASSVVGSYSELWDQLRLKFMLRKLGNEHRW